MPIKPENKKLYPKDWKRIRAAILDRDSHQCRLCFVENHATGIRSSIGEFTEISGMECETIGLEGARTIQIVLTIAHFDQDPTNNNWNNLAALCQRCHNIIDASARAKNAGATRAKKADHGVFNG